MARSPIRHTRTLWIRSMSVGTGAALIGVGFGFGGLNGLLLLMGGLVPIGAAIANVALVGSRNDACAEQRVQS